MSASIATVSLHQTELGSRPNIHGSNLLYLDSNQKSLKQTCNNNVLMVHDLAKGEERTEKKEEIV